ncbi:MAG: pyridoxal phosphate-dependent aminotransferase [Anaerolineales bacterium]
MTSLNTQFDLIRQSATVAMADRVVNLCTQGRKIIRLEVGDPDFATPPAVIDVALRAMQAGATHYGPSRGTLELRKAVAERMARVNGVDYDPETEILATHGAIHAYYCAIQSILNPGDEVLIPDPSWATHSNMVTMLRGQATRVPALAEDGFLPTLEAWERALTQQTRAIVVNWPSNPTGVIAPRDYLLELAKFAVRRDLWIISDEVYENLVYDGRQPTCIAALPGMKERALVLNSLSKTYAMTGWRVGYLAAPQRVIESALKASQNSITCVAPFIQKAAAFALSAPSVQQAASDMRDAYARRRELVLRLAREHGPSPVKVSPPDGAFYFFVDMRNLGIPSIELCERLLDEASVALVPGAAFGEQGEGFVRMTIAASEAEIEAGFKAILAWADKVA